MGTALITGGSSGIGYELARIFAANRYDLILVARNGKKLERASESLRGGVEVTSFAIDLAEPGSAREVYETVHARGFTIDILVNNAGFGSYGAFHDSDYKTQMDMVRVNVSALTALTLLFIKDMVKRGSGRILNVSSTAAFQPGPLMAVYYASKAYVLNFSRAVSAELKGTGVTMTVLCPGATRTGFQKTAGIGKSRLFRLGTVHDPAIVARTGYRALMRGQSLAIPGLLNKIHYCGARIVPPGLLNRLVMWMQKSRSRR